jgi:release factor glutamine methyltransferase
VLVDRRVLIPRPETELLVEHAVRRVAERRRAGSTTPIVADLGTGSGVIGLSIATETAPAPIEVWLTDVSTDALDVARANLAGTGRAGAQVRVAEGSWFAALPSGLQGRLDVLVSNPPYIAVDDPELDASVREWEPELALLSGADGLDALRTIVAGAAEWLAPGGWLLVEIGHTQGDAVTALAEAAGLVDVCVIDDLAGRPRIVEARRQEKRAAS